MECRAEVAGNRCLEVERFARHGVVERQAEGMQAHARAGIILTAILAVTHDRVTDVGHVDTDLVLAACEQVEEQQ